MTNSIVLLTNSSGNYRESISMPDCCETLGASVMQYQTKNMDYRYLCIIPFTQMDEFFKKPENMVAYITILGEAFDYKCELLTEVDKRKDIPKHALSTYSTSDHHIVEVISKTQRTNKELVAFHTCLRYTWYLHFSNIATACVNLLRLGVTENAFDILAIASSYQTSNGRALLPTALTNIDGFIYFPDKKRVMADLERGNAFNTAFMKTPIYYQPLIPIKGNFFDNNSETYLSAKNLIQALGSVDDIADIPEVIVDGIKTAIEEYVSSRKYYHMIASSAKTYNITQTLLSREDINKGKIKVAMSSLSGVYKEIEVILTTAVAVPTSN